MGLTLTRGLLLPLLTRCPEAERTRAEHPQGSLQISVSRREVTHTEPSLWLSLDSLLSLFLFPGNTELQILHAVLTRFYLHRCIYVHLFGSEFGKQHFALLQSIVERPTANRVPLQPLLHRCGRTDRVHYPSPSRYACLTLVHIGLNWDQDAVEHIESCKS